MIYNKDMLPSGTVYILCALDICRRVINVLHHSGCHLVSKL